MGNIILVLAYDVEKDRLTERIVKKNIKIQKIIVNLSDQLFRPSSLTT